MPRRPENFKVELSPEGFKVFAVQVLNSCKLRSQAHIAHAFLIERLSALKFNPIDKDKARDIVQFLFEAKMDELNKLPQCGMWFDDREKHE